MNKRKGRHNNAQLLRKVADDESLLNVGRVAVQRVLIDFRDNRICLISRGNGLVIRERDGADSSVIRLGTDQAIRIALRAIATHLVRKERLKRKRKGGGA